MKKSTLLLSVLLFVGLLVNAQVERNMVAVEIGTGTWCTYCPGAALGADDLVANGMRVAIIENHNGDTYANDYSNARNSYYNISGYPTARFDGVLSVVGGDHTVSMYPSYLPKYNQRIAIASPITIDYTATQNGLQFVFNFTITKVSALPSDQLIFHFAVTQSEIAQVWQGQDHLNYVNRLMIPDQGGTDIDFSSGNVQTVSITANVDPLWPLEDIEFVAFVQNNADKEILQCIRPVITDFEASSPTEICQHNSITFANSSVGRPASYAWSFPGGTPSSSTGDAPAITYNTPGVYDVTLVTTTGLQTQTIVKTGYVTINPGAEVTDPAGPQVVCTNNVGQTTDYSTSSSSATQYIWDFYPATGAGTIVNNGSTATVSWNHNWYGTASIRVKGINECGEGSWTEYMDISAVNCTGQEEAVTVQPIQVYPNPARKDLNIVLNSKTPDIVEIRLMNALGKVMATETLQVNGKAFSSINVSRMPEGMYFLSINGKELKSSQKITIQR
ncbi:MAG: T9SS type A sorting domain-containing protein [Bacteroidales bacterium]|nr:T9SS type A sorting domain-containing protein [Bacteroidales bacterium]